MKKCTKCLEEKPESEFGRCSKVKSGLLAQCKACCRARAKAWWSTEKGLSTLKARKESEEYAEYRRRYYQRNRDKILSIPKTPEARARAYEAQKRWRAKNRLKLAAHDAVKYRVNVTGDLTRPETLLCCECGGQAQEYHHHDYSRPLDVVALCVPCHRRHHRPRRRHI